MTYTLNNLTSVPQSEYVCKKREKEQNVLNYILDTMEMFDEGSTEKALKHSRKRECINERFMLFFLCKQVTLWHKKHGIFAHGTRDVSVVQCLAESKGFHHATVKHGNESIFNWMYLDKALQRRVFAYSDYLELRYSGIKEMILNQYKEIWEN